MRDGMHVRHRIKEMGIGTIIAVIHDEGMEVVRVQWSYEHGIKEHVKSELSIFIPAGDRRYGHGY